MQIIVPKAVQYTSLINNNNDILNGEHFNNVSQFTLYFLIEKL